MKIKAVRFQNCFSFGNQLTEVRFDGISPSLVVGKNGAGKSSAVLDTLVYALYGKPYRNVRLGQMINTINGRDMVVEADLTAKGKEWTIRRGQKPNLFEIYCEGEMLDQQSSVKEQQEWLENHVLLIDHKTFLQTVILGSANHVPFMQLPAAQRREVIEDILDIQVFSVMNQVLKEKAGDIKERVQAAEKELAVLRKELEVEEKHLERQMLDVSRIKDEKNSALVERLEQIKTNNATIKELKKEADQLSVLTEDEPGLKKSHTTMVELEMKLRTRMDNIARELNFYDHNEHCPTCAQTIDRDFVANIKKEKNETLKSLRNGIEEVERKKTALHDQLTKISEVFIAINKIDNQIRSAQLILDRANHEVDTLEREIAALNEEQEDRSGLIDELRSKVAELGRSRDEVMGEAKLMGIASLLLKDGGIKTKIVAQYIPLMNRLVNKYLAALELYVDFHLDETFSETIRSRHRDTFSYDSFSEGEKLKLDLAILFAWRDIAKMRSNSSVDLIIFDEILDSSLDTDGIDYFLRVISSISTDTGVMIISHRDGVEDKFGRVLTFIKRDNFSRLLEN